MEGKLPLTPGSQSPPDDISDLSAIGSMGVSVLRSWLSPPRVPGFVARVDHYDLVRLIGIGGMGAVFLAQDSRAAAQLQNQIDSLQRHSVADSIQGAMPGALPAPPLAIKVLKPEYQLDSRCLALFKRECRHLEQLSHPNVLRPVCSVTEAPRAYIVMPYYQRGSLAQRISHGPAFEPPAIRRIAMEIASALLYTHRKGIVHGDLKPANVLLTDEDSVIVADFGLARSVISDSLHDLSRPGGAGTVSYLSPALAAGDAEDTRCDLYALGAILYELLTSRPPYVGSDRDHILRQILAGPPEPILSLNPLASKPLVQIAEKAMARNLRDRYTSAQDVLEDLEAIETPDVTNQFSCADRPLPLHSSRNKALALVSVLALLSCLIWFRKPVPTSTPAPAVTRNSDKPELLLVGSAAYSSTSNDQFHLGRLHGDIRPKIFIFSDHKHLRILDEEGKSVGISNVSFQDSSREALVFDLLQDVDEDGEDELFFSWREGSKRVISVRNLNLFEIRNFEARGQPGTGTPGSIEYLYNRIVPQSVVRLTPKSNQSLLAIMKTGYEKSPRGVWCFDYQTGNIQWKYETAPMVEKLHTADLDGDGQLEIIFTGNAVRNFHVLGDGTTDSDCYLYVLNADGKLVWKYRLGGERVYSTLLLGPMTNHGSPNLYVVTRRSWHHGYQEFGQLFRFGSHGALLRVVNLTKHVGDPVIADTGSGIQILLPDRDGTIHAFDSDLNQLATRALKPRVHDEVVIHLGILTSYNGERRADHVLALSWDNILLRADNEGTDAAPPNRTEVHSPSLSIMGTDLAVACERSLTQHYKSPFPFRTLIFPPRTNHMIRVALFAGGLQLFDYVPKP